MEKHTGPKTLWLEFEDPNPWHSSHVLQQSYLELYQAVLPNLLVKKIAWNSYLTPGFWSSLAALNIESIILADMRFDLVHWLPYLQKHLQAGIDIQVHIYGNPLKRMKRLLGANLDFNLYNLTFIVGSMVQKQVFENILNNPANVTYLPFLPPAFYTYDKNKRNEWRKKNDVDEEKLFLYSGRISFQKNVHYLMELFSIHYQASPNSRLIIAGVPDNLNWRDVPRAKYLNYAGEIFFEKLESLQSQNIPITYLGKLSPTELQDVYSGCDHLVSLGTFDGEDFGLSVAEGLSVGLPCALTSWGGHKEFGSLHQVQLSRVEISEKNLGIDLDEFVLSLQQDLSERIKNIENFNRWRTQRELQAHSTLLGLKPYTFESFNESFKQYCLNQKPSGDFFEQDKEFLSPYWT